MTRGNTPGRCLAVVLTAQCDKETYFGQRSGVRRDGLEKTKVRVGFFKTFFYFPNVFYYSKTFCVFVSIIDDKILLVGSDSNKLYE